MKGMTYSYSMHNIYVEQRTIAKSTIVEIIKKEYIEHKNTKDVYYFYRLMFLFKELNVASKQRALL